jgi:hypothetical protein
MRRITVIATACLFMAVPTFAQIVVVDPANLYQAILIAERTLSVRMARSLDSLDRYRTPPIAITGHDPSRWPYGAPWLRGLNSGDARGTLYEQTARRLERPGTELNSLPTSARKAVENAYATVEITDSVAGIAGHQVALVRGYNGLLQQVVQEFENDVLNTLPRYHEMTTVLDKVAAGELVARRQDMATNQLLSHALEQLLARSKRMRDTEAATMNMRLMGMRQGRTAGANLIRGTADDLRTWRQP